MVVAGAVVVVAGAVVVVDVVEVVVDVVDVVDVELVVVVRTDVVGLAEPSPPLHPAASETTAATETTRRSTMGPDGTGDRLDTVRVMAPSTEYDAVVVGAGPNGLVAAITMARAGGACSSSRPRRHRVAGAALPS